MLDGNVVKCCAVEKALDGEARDLIKLTLVHCLPSLAPVAQLGMDASGPSARYIFQLFS